MKLVITADGIAAWHGARLRCALGRGGIRTDKSEGDGATPTGTYRFVEIFYRADRLDRPETDLPATALTESDGWCDDPAHPDYNRRVSLPHAGRCETMWRADRLYDIVVVTDHNSEPVIPGAGSGIFVHVAGGPDYPPTAGCVAFSADDLRRILRDWTDADRLVIAAAG